MCLSAARAECISEGGGGGGGGGGRGGSGRTQVRVDSPMS